MKQLFLVVILMVSGACAFAEESTQTATLTSPYPPIIDPNPPVSYEEQVDFIVRKFEQYFPGDEMMLCIGEEESTGLIHWLPSGELIPVEIDADEDGVRDSSAVGVLQTLAYLHRDELKRLGLSLADIDEYFRFNRHLRRTQGYEAWKASYNTCKTKGVEGTSLMAMK